MGRFQTKADLSYYAGWTLNKYLKHFFVTELVVIRATSSTTMLLKVVLLLFYSSYIITEFSLSAMSGEAVFSRQSSTAGFSTKVPVEHLDYDYIEKCKDVKYLEKILRILR